MALALEECALKRSLTLRRHLQHLSDLVSLEGQSRENPCNLGIRKTNGFHTADQSRHLPTVYTS